MQTYVKQKCTFIGFTVNNNLPTCIFSKDESYMFTNTAVDFDVNSPHSRPPFFSVCKCGNLTPSSSSLILPHSSPIYMPVPSSPMSKMPIPRPHTIHGARITNHSSAASLPGRPRKPKRLLKKSHFCCCCC